jgi:outer membrane protein assembly factor BamB
MNFVKKMVPTWIVLGLGLMVCSTGLCQAGQTVWSTPIEGKITMCKIVDSSIIVRSTETDLSGMDLRTGEILWTLAGVSCRGEGQFGLVPGTSYAIATDGVVEEQRDDRSRALVKKVHDRLVALDYRQGVELWNTDGLNMFSVVGYFPLHHLGSVMVCGRDELFNYRMAAVDLATGELIWENPNFFTERNAVVFHDPTADWTLDGNQLPVLDTDTTMITMLNNVALRKWNATTGELIWETELGTRKAPTLRDGYPLMMLSDDRSVVYVPAEENMFAIDTRDGSMVWPEKADLRGRVQQMELLPRGLLLKGGPNSEGKGGKPFVTLIDPQTGLELWEKPFTRIRGFKVSPALVEEDTLYIWSDKKLYAVSLADGSYEERGTELKCEGGDNSFSLTRRNGDFLLLSEQNVMGVGSDGFQTFHTHLKEPGTSFFVKAAAFTATVAINTFSAMYVQVPIYTTTNYMYYVYPTMNLMRFPQYGNSTDAGDYMYMLTNLEVKDADGKQKGPGLAKVDKNTGEIVAKIVLGDKTPMYSIDDTESLVVYVDDETTVVCAEL